MRLRALAAGVCLAALRAASAAAQSDDTMPLPPGRPPEWGVAEGFGFTLRVNAGRSHELALYAYPGVSLRLSPRLEYLIEGHFAHFVSPGGYVVGLVPLAARLYVGRGRILPYGMLGAGAGWTDLVGLREIDQRFNFLLQGGFGVRSRISDARAWTAEVRWTHVSNAGMGSPNLGLNMLVFLGGFRFR
jgi:opacity protein-like surface antigen